MNKELLLWILLLLPIASHAIPVDSITVEGAATFSAATANTVPYLDGSKAFTSSAVTPTELGYLSGATSSIQTQLGNKEPTITATTSADYYRGDKTFQNFTSAAQASVVTQMITNGVTATAPSEDAVFDALALKAPLASPDLTGNPTAPTQTAADNSTKIATTAYSDNAASAAVTAAIVQTITNGDTTHASSSDALFDALALKLDTTLADTKILVGNGSNIATAVFASGDLTLANTGAFTIANLAVTNAKIANATIDLTTKVTGVNPVANGGTNKASYTAGSIVFAGAGGTTLTENIAFPFSWDNTNSRLNIGATGTGKINVTAAGGTDIGINVFSTAANNAIQVQNQSGYSLSLTNAAASALAGASIGGAFSRGTLASKTQSLAGDQLFSLTAQGYTGSAAGPGFSGAISFVATENTTASANGGSLVLSTTPNGSLTPSARVTIGQNGVVNVSNLTASLPVQTDASKNLVSAAITLSGSQVTGILANANTTATSANTASAIVARDGSGNFSAGTITASLTGHASLDLALTGGTMAGNIAMGSNRVTGLADPSSSQDAATKAYVDSASLNGVAKQESLYATVAALPANTYNNGASGVGATLTGVSVGALSIDGSTPSVNDRILVKNEVAQANNGIYTVTTVGSGIAVYVLTRATDFNNSSDIVGGSTTFIASGSTLSSTTWQLSVAGAVTVGTTALPFIQIAGVGTYVAGTGIGISGNIISLNNTAVSAGSYTNANITVDAQGRITAAASGSTSTFAVSNISGNTTGSAAVNIYVGDTSGGAFTFTLPSAASNSGVAFVVKNITFGGSNNIAVALTGGDTVEGAASDQITAGKSRYYFSNGTSWFILQ